MQGSLAVRGGRATSIPTASGLARGLALLVAVLLVAALVHRAPDRPPLARGKADPLLLQAGEAAVPGSTLSLILREQAPPSDEAERLVTELGGTVTRDLAIIGGFAARIPAENLPRLLASPAVSRVWGDARIRVAGSPTDEYEDDAPNTVWRDTIRLTQAARHYTGDGVTVALLDTGVSRVADLEDAVVARVDFTPDHDGFDRYGHGTHMAGIIAGDGSGSDDRWIGVAPEADLVSVKVARADGSTDVSVVIGALQWVLENRARYGIRVLNLAFGTDSTQSYLIDPLDFAVERLWFAGILVVVSAGNRGPAGGTISKPGDDPYVLTVGAADLKQTTQKADDEVPPFSSRGPTGDGVAKPDLVAPGVTIVSSLAPGSTVAQLHPAAVVDGNYLKGTGTSQAAAIVSGVAALMFEANPSLTPDVAKATLIGTVDGTIARQPGGGAGLVDAMGAISAAARGRFLDSPANRGLTPSAGDGSLEASRGSFHVMADLDGDGEEVDDPVVGEIDVLGQPWDSLAWWARPWSESAWASLVAEWPGWEARSWSGGSWSGTTWDARSWSVAEWSARSWS